MAVSDLISPNTPNTSQVEVIDDDDPDTPLALLTEGNHFGQRSLLYDKPRGVSVKAKTHCDIFSLSRADFEQVVHSHPAVVQQINTIAQELFGTAMLGL